MNTKEITYHKVNEYKCHDCSGLKQTKRTKVDCNGPNWTGLDRNQLNGQTYTDMTERTEMDQIGPKSTDLDRLN